MGRDPIDDRGKKYNAQIGNQQDKSQFLFVRCLVLPQLIKFG